MSEAGKYPTWQDRALATIRRFQKGEIQLIKSRNVWNAKGQQVSWAMNEQRDDWGEAFLCNLETIILSLNSEYLSERSNMAVEEFFGEIFSICAASTNHKWRVGSFDESFINHIAAPILSREGNPEEAIRTFGEALRKTLSFRFAGRDILENASRLTDRDCLEGTLKLVEKEFTPTRM